MFPCVSRQTKAACGTSASHQVAPGGACASLPHAVACAVSVTSAGDSGHGGGVDGSSADACLSIRIPIVSFWGSKHGSTRGAHHHQVSAPACARRSAAARAEGGCSSAPSRPYCPWAQNTRSSRQQAASIRQPASVASVTASSAAPACALPPAACLPARQTCSAVCAHPALLLVVVVPVAHRPRPPSCPLCSRQLSLRDHASRKQ